VKLRDSKFPVQNFPRSARCFSFLAERDAAGGFGDHLKKVAAKAQAKLDSAKHQVTADFSRPRLLLASYMQVEEIGKEVGEEALKRLGKDVFAIARDQFADDIFTPSMEDITVRKNSFRPGGARTVRFEYKKNKCDYSVIYSWRLSD